MADRDPESFDRGERRGLTTPSIQRGTTARIAIRIVRGMQRLLWQALEVLLAVIILFEEWGWRPLAAALARLAEFDLVARLETWVRVLPPWPALAVFLVPSVLFLPLKLAALWLIGGGHVVWATVLFAFAKIAGTALYARIFQLTQPSLMQLSWFARLYNWFVPWKDAIVAEAKRTAIWQAAAAFKVRVKLAARSAWVRLRPAVLATAVRLMAVLGRRH